MCPVNFFLDNIFLPDKTFNCEEDFDVRGQVFCTRHILAKMTCWQVRDVRIWQCTRGIRKGGSCSVTCLLEWRVSKILATSHRSFQAISHSCVQTNWTSPVIHRRLVWNENYCRNSLALICRQRDKYYSFQVRNHALRLLTEGK